MSAPEATKPRKSAEQGTAMAAEPTPTRDATKPRLVYFHSQVSGACRRVDGFLAQVLQRRGNHDTFRLYRVAQEERPDLIERFAVKTMPTLIVLDGNAVAGRLEQPRGCREIEKFLSPWLQ